MLTITAHVLANVLCISNLCVWFGLISKTELMKTDQKLKILAIFVGNDATGNDEMDDDESVKI